MEATCLGTQLFAVSKSETVRSRLFVRRSSYEAWEKTRVVLTANDTNSTLQAGMADLNHLQSVYKKSPKTVSLF